MTGSDVASGIADLMLTALTPSRWELVLFGVVFVCPWLCGVVWLSAMAVQFVVICSTTCF